MRTNLSNHSFVILIFFLFFTSCQKDETEFNLVLKAKPVDVKDQTIYETLNAFKAYEFINLDEFNFKEFINIEIHFGNDYIWKLSLTENLGLTENLESYITTDEGTFKVEQDSRHYKGALVGKTNSTVRVSFFDNKMMGFIYDGTETYQIIHLSTVSDLENYPNVMIVAKDSDFVPEEVSL